MSKYTTQVRAICGSYLTDEERAQCLPVGDIIEKTKDKVFNFSFPWYSDNGDGLPEFKSAFLATYYFDYIGAETLGAWKAMFIGKMSRVMDRYKAVYSQIKSTNDPLNNVDVKRDGTSSGTTSYNTSTNGQSINSDNPQVTVATNDYASSMYRGENVGNGSGETSETTGEHETGIRGKSKSRLIYEYRREFININEELIDMCKDLFLGVW